MLGSAQSGVAGTVYGDLLADTLSQQLSAGRGLGLVDDIKNDLSSTLLRTGRDSLSEIVGADAATITAEDWPV